MLGDDMIDTLRAATSLAVSLRKAGDQAEAMELAQDTYESLFAPVRQRIARRRDSVRYQSGV